MKKTKYTTHFYNDYIDESSSSACIVRDTLLKHISKPNTVIDVGCGIGTWLKAWHEIGSTVQGVDGAYVKRAELLIDPANFMEMDLASPIPIDRKFDLAESLEVAEHLADNKADGFVEFLCSLSSMVLFGAAMPYQGGTHHINEQWPEYWAAKFHKLGYVCVDVIRDEVWTNDKCAYYYAQNTFLYVQKDLLNDYPHLKTIAEKTDITFLGRVHPKKWIEAHEGTMKLEILLKRFPSSFFNFFDRAFNKIKQSI